VIPQSTGWQSLRSLCLDAIPADTKVFHTRATPLHKWRQQGAFIVSACTKKYITIESAGAEIGEVLLSDTEYLLDHAAEHRALIHDVTTNANWHSPAWTVVTAYYWVFFTALALTRMTGRTIWFLDKTAIAELRALAGSLIQPGAGPMNLTVGPYSTATNRILTLRPSKRQFHDTVWKVMHDLTAEVLAKSDQKAEPLEYRLWWALGRVGSVCGTDWMSRFRNSVNYRPGWGYREVIRRGEIDFVRRLRPLVPAKMEALIGELEDRVIALPAGADPDTDVKGFGALLGLYGYVMASVVSTLHSEIITRKGGDPRWRTLRSTFLSKRCSSWAGDE
jgi:hypothetical protein